MGTATVEALRAKSQELKAKEHELTDLFHSAHGGSPAAAKAREEIRLKLQENGGQQRELGPKIVEAKEARRRQDLIDLLGSREYHEAVEAALAGLEARLAPFLPYIRLTNEARRASVAAPLTPPSIGAEYIEAKEWIAFLIRLKVLDAKSLPKGLRSLIEEVK